MRRAWTILAACCAWSGFAAAQTTVAYEGFDYLKGGCLADGATGSGWAGPWAGAGEGGSLWSELIIGPGSFPVPPGSPAPTGQHVDLNQLTGERRISRRLGTDFGPGTTLQELAFAFVLDFGPGMGVDYAGIELSHSAGGPVVFLGKPPGAGAGVPGTIGMDVYGQGFTGTGVGGNGQKRLRLQWSPNPIGPETLTLLVSDAASGSLLGSTSQTVEANFNQVTLVARRDLAFGGAIPAFDELVATVGPIQTRLLQVASANPAAGVTIEVSPADLNGAATGDTVFERAYPLGTSVTLSTPATAAGNAFLKWTLGGADYSTRRSITLAMGEDRALVAVYAAPPPVVHCLSVSASGAPAPVTIAVSPPDQSGSADGATPFARTYAEGTIVSLAAPDVAGMVFGGWLRNGASHASTPAISTTLDADALLTAVYRYPLDERITGLTVGDQEVGIAWSAIGGRSYVVEATSDLAAGFEPISGVIVPPGEGLTTASFVEDLPEPRPPARFYRLRIVAP